MGDRHRAPAAQGEAEGVFLGPSLLTENRQLKADLDSSVRERRLLQGRIHRGQQELGKEKGVLEDEGLRPELRQVIVTHQIKDHKNEAPQGEPAPAGGARHAAAEAVYDDASDGREQDVLHGREQELRSSAPVLGGQGSEGGREPLRLSRGRRDQRWKRGPCWGGPGRP